MNKDDHFSEAFYQIWRRGGNPDRLSYEQSERDWYYGEMPDYTAEMEIRKQRKQYETTRKNTHYL